MDELSLISGLLHTRNAYCHCTDQLTSVGGSASYKQRIHDVVLTGTSDPVVQVQWAKKTEEGLKSRVRNGGIDI